MAKGLDESVAAFRHRPLDTALSPRVDRRAGRAGPRGRPDRKRVRAGCHRGQRRGAPGDPRARRRPPARTAPPGWRSAAREWPAACPGVELVVSDAHEGLKAAVGAARRGGSPAARTAPLTLLASASWGGSPSSMTSGQRPRRYMCVESLGKARLRLVGCESAHTAPALPTAPSPSGGRRCLRPRRRQSSRGARTASAWPANAAAPTATCSPGGSAPAGAARLRRYDHRRPALGGRHELIINRDGGSGDLPNTTCQDATTCDDATSRGGGRRGRDQPLPPRKPDPHSVDGTRDRRRRMT